MISPSSSHEPIWWLMTQVFLPIQPTPRGTPSVPGLSIVSGVQEAAGAWIGRTRIRGCRSSSVPAPTPSTTLSRYRRWYESLTQLWRQFGTVPVSFADSLEGAIQRDAAIVGSPGTVRAEVKRQLAATEANYFVGRFIFGTLPLERALRSIELFSREVMPAVLSRPSAP